VAINFRAHYRSIDDLTDQVLGTIDPQGYELPEKVQRRADRLQSDLMLAWIFHDCGLDGTVVTHAEMTAALSRRVITDSSLMPLYQEIVNHSKAVEHVRSRAKAGELITVEYIRDLHVMLCEGLPNIPQPGRYRSDQMLHRVYLHDIQRPDRISYHLNKLVRAQETEKVQSSHPIKRAVLFHREFMHIFPFFKFSGKLGRLLMNHILMANEYFPCILHVKVRQRYYVALRDDPEALRLVVVEAMKNTLEHAAEAVSG